MPWLIPVIQGFVQTERISVRQGDSEDKSKEIDVVIISRRSRYRAGNYKPNIFAKKTGY